MNDETLVVGGHELKALGDGRVGGYLVRFGGPAERDLVGDYFTKDTYFGPHDGDGADVLFHHGIPVGADLEMWADQILGQLTTRRDDLGVWAETVLNMANDYQRAVYAMTQKGLLSWSSGSASHMVKRDDDGRITRWPIIEGSLTPTPAEPRFTNRISPLRSLPAVSILPDWVVDPSTLFSAHSAPHKETLPMSEITTVGPDVQPVPNPASAADAATIAQAVVAALKSAEASEAEKARVAAVAQAKADEADALKARIDELERVIKAAPTVINNGVQIPDGASVEVKGDARLAAPKYMDAFKGWMHSGEWNDGVAVKVPLAEGAGANGGYLVPALYANELVLPLTDLSYLRNAGARIITLSGTNAFDVPSLGYSGAATLVTEAGAYSNTEPTAGHITFAPYKYTKMSKASEEVVADSRFDIWAQILQPDYLQAFAAAENIAFTVGTGSGQPQGVVTGATATPVTAAAAATIAADDLINVYHGLDYKYRPNAKFMMADATLQAVKKLKDSTGSYLWGPGLNGAQEGMLLGKPVVVNNSMAAIGTTNKSVLFGDFSYFWVADWQEIAVQRLVELFAGNGQIGFRALKRFDSHVMLAAAFITLQHP